MQPLQYNFWLVVWNIFYFSIYWEGSSQLTNIFQRDWNHQPDLRCPAAQEHRQNDAWTVSSTAAFRDWVAKRNGITRKNVGKTTPELSVPLQGRSGNDPGSNERVPQPSAGQASPSIFRDVLCCKTQHFVHLLSLKNAFRARLPWKAESWSCENEACAGDFPQNVKVEDVKTKLSYETSSKSESGRCENEAFVPDFLQMFESSSGENEACAVSSTAGPIQEWSWFKRRCSATVRRTSLPIHLPRRVLSCKTQHFVHLLSLQNAFHARLPSKTASWRCENEACVRDVLKIWKWKMWKRSFRDRRPSEDWSWGRENEAFVRDFPQKVKGDDLKLKLLCDEAFARDFPLGCEISWLWDFCDSG